MRFNEQLDFHYCPECSDFTRQKYAHYRDCDGSLIKGVDDWSTSCRVVFDTKQNLYGNRFDSIYVSTDGRSLFARCLKSLSRRPDYTRKHQPEVKNSLFVDRVGPFRIAHGVGPVDLDVFDIHYFDGLRGCIWQHNFDTFVSDAAETLSLTEQILDLKWSYGQLQWYLPGEFTGQVYHYVRGKLVRPAVPLTTKKGIVLANVPTYGFAIMGI